MNRIPLSAVVITLDAAAQLPACLASLAFCDEIVVVDSGSRDATLYIAREHDARVIYRDWLGYGRQKQLAVEQAEWGANFSTCAGARNAIPLKAASAALAASIFHFNEIDIPDLKNYLHRKGIPVRPVQ